MLGGYETWEDDALCKEVGNELFFPEYQGSNTYHLAQRVCAMCPVKAQCLERALRDEEPHGMWGGVTPHSRLGMLKKMHGEDYCWPRMDDGLGEEPPRMPGYCKNNLHRLTDENTVLDSRGYRRCAACRSEAFRRRNSRKRNSA